MMKTTTHHTFKKNRYFVSCVFDKFEIIINCVNLKILLYLKFKSLFEVVENLNLNIH